MAYVINEARIGTRGTSPRVLAIIAPGDGPHLITRAGPTPRIDARSPLPLVGLGDALSLCLEMLERDPPRFQRAATAWHARWCSVLPGLTLADAQVTLAALEALAGPDPAVGARQLRRQSAHHGLSSVVRVLDAWIAGRERLTRRRAGPPSDSAATLTAAAESVQRF